MDLKVIQLWLITGHFSTHYKFFFEIMRQNPSEHIETAPILKGSYIK